ncbi:MAG: MGMT family protein [Sphaerochaetaceae bacterium]|jgi:methylated-DNA-protein-cysteine methyltransferase-like protein
MDVSFRDRVYDLVGRIPSGSVATYGLVAFLAGNPRASRIVGSLMAHVPEGLGLPCHRVVYRDGSLCKGFSFGGADEGYQRWLLEQEGVVFSVDGKVDIARCLWDGS